MFHGENVPRGTFFYGILKKEVLYCRKDAKKTRYLAEVRILWEEL
jgi:hypothetical protein